MPIKKISNINELMDTLQKSKYVFVDFFANWCGPCKMLSPVVDEISNEFRDINFVKVDIDSVANISQVANITSVPTVLFFKDRKLVKSFVGYLPKEEIIKFIKSNK